MIKDSFQAWGMGEGRTTPDHKGTNLLWNVT